MQRRTFLRLLSGTITFAPLSARAQQSLPVIGFLHSADAKSFALQVAAFRQGLKDGGFEEGRNLAFEYRWAEGHADRLPALAADLVRRNVSVIAAMGGNVSTLAAKGATKTIPIVFGSGSDPIKLGLVASLGHPEGNLTGITFFFSDLVPKQLDLLHQVVPGAATVGVLTDPTSPESWRQPDDARSAASKLGVEVKLLNASDDAQLDRIFAELPQLNVGALIVAGNPFFGSRVKKIVDLVAPTRIPTMYYRREFVVAGGLLCYGTSIVDAYRQAGLYAAKILKGAKPAELPIVQTTKFDFAINLKTAKSLGLEIHPQLLATADEVIE